MLEQKQIGQPYSGLLHKPSRSWRWSSTPPKKLFLLRLQRQGPPLGFLHLSKLLKLPRENIKRLSPLIHFSPHIFITTGYYAVLRRVSEIGWSMLHSSNTEMEIIRKAITMKTYVNFYSFVALGDCWFSVMLYLQ